MNELAGLREVTLPGSPSEETKYYCGGLCDVTFFRRLYLVDSICASLSPDRAGFCCKLLFLNKKTDLEFVIQSQLSCR
jgi:hypothetical protein